MVVIQCLLILNEKKLFNVIHFGFNYRNVELSETISDPNLTKFKNRFFNSDLISLSE